MGRFHDVLSRPGLAFIAEAKKRSPSAGDIRLDADVATVAASFAASGAAAVSVLVEERFAGSWDDLAAARAQTDVPLLAKGFFRDLADLQRARAYGADAVLLLLRDLDFSQARQLIRLADDLNLDVLLEAHDEDEIDEAIRLGAPIIGVNARDLDSFAIDRRQQLELIARLPRDRIIVAESGIASRAQAAQAELAGAKAVLVGTTLMRAPDPAAKLRELTARPLAKVCGLTRQEDVDAAVAAGADLVGFVFAPSPRRAPGLLDVPDTVLSVEVHIGDSLDSFERVGADLVQLYPEEDGHRGQDAVIFLGEREVATVIDLAWDQEPDLAAHWQRARATRGRIMLAGRLSGTNVAAALAAVEPWAVDAASELEDTPGTKDKRKVQDFVAASRGQS